MRLVSLMRGLNDGDTMAPNDEASFWLANDSNKQTRFTRETFHVSLRSRLKTPVSILSAKKKAQTQARLTL